MSFFAKNLSFLIEQKGLSPEDLAVNFGVDIATLSKVLKNQMEPSVSFLIKTADYFGLTIDKLLRDDLKTIREKLASLDIKLFIIDVDGVMTDGGMYYTESGDEFKKFNTKDGMAIKGLTKKGFDIGIISSGLNKNLIGSRAALLGIKHVYVGLDGKLGVLKEWCSKLNIDLSNVAFIGDDINDLDVMSRVGLAACPADAVSSIKNVAHIHLQRKGGEGCVRELVDEYLSLLLPQ